MSDDRLNLTVTAIRTEAVGIASYELSAAEGELPAFTAGAHIDIHLPNGLVRSYSLLNDPAERHRYVVAVANDSAGRGGSRFLHETVRAGTVLAVSPPRNHFPLVEDAPDTVLIAGGIGITPLICMIRRLETLGRPWRLYYSARSRIAAACMDVIADYADRVECRFDDETGGIPFDLPVLVAGVDPSAHLYCCGPAPMLNAFEAACVDRAAETVHLEYFTAAPAAPTTGTFDVHLARTGGTFTVQVGETILDGLLAVGLDIPFSCQEGTCGECETRVLSGEPDHRDVVLSRKQRENGRVMMVCCSRAKTSSLTLDL